MPDGPLLRALHALTGADATPDAELLRRFAAARDDTAFELLVRRHADLVWKVCRAVLRDDPHAAEDAFQAAFLALAKSAHSVGGESVPGWLYRVARNAALRARRTASRTPDPLPDTLPATSPAPDDAAASGELAALLTEEVGRLAAKFREPVLLCFFEGHTHAEAAERLGWAVGTVASRIARAKDRLRDRLARRGVALSAAGLTAALSMPASAVPPGLVRACVLVAAGRAAATAPVLTLTEGVLSVMRTAKLKATAAAVTLLVGLAGGGTLLAVNRPQDPPPKAAGAPKAAAPERPAVPQMIAKPEHRVKSRRHLEQLAAALFAYQLDHGHLPTDVLDPKTKKPLLSWRVAILPYIEQKALHKQFKLDEPWDSEHNKKAAAVWIKLYSNWVPLPGNEPRDMPYGMTRVKRFTGPDTLHIPGGQVDVTKTPDGREWTVLLAEVGDPVPWAKPDDPVATHAGNFTLKDPTVWKGPFSNVINVALANGRAVALKPNLDADVVSGLVYWNDGRVLPKWEEIAAAPPPPAGEGDLDDLVEESKRLADEVVRIKEELAKNRKWPPEFADRTALEIADLTEQIEELRKRAAEIRNQFRHK